MQAMLNKANILSEMLPYLQKFRKEVVVVKFGGSAMEDPKVTERVLQDIVLLECMGIRVAIVHGGGKAISAKLETMGIKPLFINGLRYTCSQTIGVVDDVLHNVINADLVRMIENLGGEARQLSGKAILRGEKINTTDKETGVEIDLGFVGEVHKVDDRLISCYLDAKLIPVITPLAVDKNGNILNINADVAACKIAEDLKAQKLIFLSDVPGILSDPKDESTLISSIKVKDVPKLIKDGVLSGGMLPKIKSAVSAVENGVKKVHMIDGRMEHALLLELLTDKGIGTEIIKE